MRLISILRGHVNPCAGDDGRATPFVFYGGTLLLPLFIGISILVSAQAHRKLAHS